MANGTDDFDENRLPEVKRFFAPIAKDLEEFGTRHNVKLEKYPRFKAVWNFLFRHPEAGSGSIQVLFSDPEHVLIVGHRSISDRERFRRSVYSSEKQIIGLDDPRLSEALTALLRELVALPIDSLVPDGRDYSQIWSTIGTREYYKYMQTLPLPIV